MDGVPEDDGVGDEVQALGLVGLFLEGAAADLALVGEEEEVAERVHRFAVVELGADPAPEGLVLQVAGMKTVFTRRPYSSTALVAAGRRASVSSTGRDNAVTANRGPTAARAAERHREREWARRARRRQELAARRADYGGIRKI
jgi:hypothetical protein